MAVVTPLNNFLGPEGDTVTVDEQLLNTEYWTHIKEHHRSYQKKLKNPRIPKKNKKSQKK
jgi:chitodextrinase